MALLAAATACSSSGSTPPPPPPSTTASQPPATSTPSAPPVNAHALRRFYDQKLSWSDCGSGFFCAQLLVPVDYAHPDGATMHIAVIRKPASGTRRGSLIINPGGPGASGLDYARSSAGDFAHVTTNFDLVSFDPRGVGQSRPVRCLAPHQLDAFIHVDPVPDSPGEHAQIIKSSRNFANACWKRNGNYLEHVGTIDAARDMDVLRSALGDSKLTYYGASYGTYMGAKYAQLFPTRIRAMVLDGALDPTQPTFEENKVQAQGFETDLRDFLANCAKQPSCPLGSTPAAAEQALDRLREQVDAHPIPVGSRTLGPGEFFEGLALGLYSPRFWPQLQNALGQAQSGNAALLLLFSDYLTERHSNGTYSNLIESNIAINCIDRPAPTSVAAYDRAAKSFGKLAPHFGTPIAYGSLPCAFWHVPPVEQAHSVTAPGAPPIVVIGTTRDPATPYVWAKALAHQLSSGVLVSFDSDGHTAFGSGNPCITTAVDTYLLQAKPPRDGLRCTAS